MLDTVRGKHSTGVASMTAQGTFNVAKAGLNAIDFMDLKMFDDILRPMNKCLMGHNRHATVGAINDENAHPFHFQNIIGSHNGSLLGTSWKKFAGGQACNVDSEALYSELNASNVATMWEMLQGAAALTWLDKRTKTLNFLRNSQRPFYYATANEGKTLMYASEPWMIAVAAARNNVKMDGKPYELPTDSHMVVSLPEKVGERVTWTVTKVQPYIAPKTTYLTSNGGLWDDWEEDDSWKKEKEEGKKLLEKEGVAVQGVIAFTVNIVRDYLDKGQQKATVIGTSLKGNPVRMFAVDGKYYEDLLTEMSELAEGIFEGRVYMSSSAGLVIAHTSVRLLATSYDEFFGQEKEDQTFLAASAEKGEKQQDNKTNSVNVILANPSITPYSIGCYKCQKLTKAHHRINSGTYCLTCARKVVEAEQRKAEERHLH